MIFYISEIGGDAVLGTAYAFLGDSLFSDELLYIITFRSVFVKRFNAFDFSGGKMKNTKRLLINTLTLAATSFLMRTVGVAFNVYLTGRLGAAE